MLFKWLAEINDVSFLAIFYRRFLFLLFDFIFDTGKTFMNLNLPSRLSELNSLFNHFPIQPNFLSWNIFFISSYHGSELVIDHSYHGNQHVLTRTFTINSSSSINLLKTCQRENTPDSSILVRICLNISLLIEQVQQMFRAYDRTCASWISVAGLL